MADQRFMGSSVAVAVTAALFSPRVREALHRGAVYGLAGAFVAGDALSSFTRGIGRGLQEANASAAGTPRDGEPGVSPVEAAQEAARAAQEAAIAAREAAEAAQKAAKPAKKTTRARKTATKAAGPSEAS